LPGRLPTQQAHLARHAVDIPWAALPKDDGGTRRQVRRHIGLEGALAARRESFPGGMPARRSRPCQQPEHGADRIWRNRGAASVAAAQPLGHGPGGLVMGRVDEDAARRGDLNPTGALSDQQGGDEASVWRLAGGKLEHEAPVFLSRWDGKRVQEALLCRLAQGRVTVERGQGSRCKMGAGGLAAAASAEKGDSAPERGRGDAGDMAHAKMLHRHGERRIMEHNVHDAQQNQGAALGERACVEDAAEVFGRERRWHRDRGTLKVGRTASYAGRARIVERLLPGFRVAAGASRNQKCDEEAETSSAGA